MKTLVRRYFVTLVCGLMLWPVVAGQTIQNPHTITGSDAGESCLTCHVSVPKIDEEKAVSTKNLPVDWSELKQDGVQMCATCHDAGAYHKVHLAVDFPVPVDLPLNQDQEMICVTCHYSHGKLASDRPQASYSFMDRIMNAERLHKSFLLRRNNSNGELCLTCHNPNEGSK